MCSRIDLTAQEVRTREEAIDEGLEVNEAEILEKSGDISAQDKT